MNRTDELAWGPNNFFAVPKHGGSGKIYRRAARPPGEQVRYNCVVEQVDTARRTLILVGGARVDYDRLRWTGPLDQLIERAVHAPDEVREVAGC